MRCWPRGEVERLLEDVINELDLPSNILIQHGQNGTTPAELVRLVLDQKNQEIIMLKQKLKELTQ